MIRKKMTDIMAREATSVDLKDLVAKFIPEAIGKDIEKACQGEDWVSQSCMQGDRGSAHEYVACKVRNVDELFL